MLSGDLIRKVKTELEVVESEMDKLSEWEQQFIENVSDQFSRSSYLTAGQINKLHQIYDKVV